jgi:hypothetical protein
VAQQPCSGSQSRECKEESGVGPRGDCFGLQDDRMVSDTIVAEDRLTITTRPGAGIGDEVLRPEKSLQCARVLASPRLSIPERLWPTPDEFGSAGSRQSNFLEFDTRIVDSKRLHGPNIPGERNRSAAPQVHSPPVKASGNGDRGVIPENGAGRLEKPRAVAVPSAAEQFATRAVERHE